MNAEEKYKDALNRLAELRGLMGAFDMAGYSKAEVSRMIGNKSKHGPPILPLNNIGRMLRGEGFPTDQLIDERKKLAKKEGIKWKQITHA